MDTGDNLVEDRAASAICPVHGFIEAGHIVHMRWNTADRKKSGEAHFCFLCCIDKMKELGVPEVKPTAGHW